MTEAATTLGLIVPLGGPTSSPSAELATVRRLAEDGVVDSVWVRDLPVVPSTDPDAGQRSDPWWYLGRLCGAGPQPVEVGTASVILGIRHPLVVARAVVGAQVDSGGRFILGVGSGGKPEMNRALGIEHRTYAQFAGQWAELRKALSCNAFGRWRDDTLAVELPEGYQPPPVYLASSDVARWEAIEGNAEGWQTFLTDDRQAFEQRYRRVCAIRGAQTPTDVRIDVHLVADPNAAPGPIFTHPARGRVRCTARQLTDLIAPWLEPPIGRLLLRLTGQGAEQAVRLVRARWPQTRTTTRTGRNC